MLEFFFDCSSPWTYLGFNAIRRVAAETGTPIVWRPILVGGIFNTINPSVYRWREAPVPAKLAYATKDLADWARKEGLRINSTLTVFPVNSVKVMRACALLANDPDAMVAFADAAFAAYWGGDQDISQDAVIAELCMTAGLEATDIFEGIARQDVKDRLRANTDELIARGGFGSPTIFVNGTDMYFGNDRIGLVRDALLRLQSD